ncbi:C2 family cysteine protease [Bifidobacterium sp. ESL0784]|uniref:C2 family cysteine protease n=1 Tax=Bifidobacterium sp. ESL0784 TaxID=2983231 RepID=UPI0023F70190|nr:C2 family cysteine protease [Bifidobacterium sp. ESL0784]MDF7640848.1 C2 family cysteine protease [Bifidobacterium sp. ESL0784]
MGLIVDKGVLHQAINESCKTINAQNQQLHQILSACDGLNGENLLTGQAWQAAKQQADVLSRQINDALAYNQAVLDDHRTLATLLDQYIDDDFISEDAVTQALDRLHQVDRAIETVRDLLPPVTRTLAGPAIDDLLAQDRRTAQWLQRKINRLHQFDQATSTLYGGDKVGADGNENGFKHHNPLNFLESDDGGLEDDSDKNYDLGSDWLDKQPKASDFKQGDYMSDCFLITTLQALADSGYDLRNGITAHKDKKGKVIYYTVLLYDNGKRVPVDVYYTYYMGTSGIASLWEAAIRQHFGQGALRGGQPNWAWKAITGRKPLKTNGNPGDEALNSKGSVDGTISVASTKPLFLHLPTDNDYTEDGAMLVSANDGTKLPGNGYRIAIAKQHAYEVVETKGDMVCLRNPWGKNYWYDKDGNWTPDNGETFWISKDDFNKAFNKVSQQ